MIRAYAPYLLALGLGLAACAWFRSNGPAVIDAGACIASDAAQGKPVAQIALDCGKDVGTVLKVLLESADPAVKNSPAAVEAEEARKAMSYGVTGK